MAWNPPILTDKLCLLQWHDWESSRTKTITPLFVQQHVRTNDNQNKKNYISATISFWGNPLMKDGSSWLFIWLLSYASVISGPTERPQAGRCRPRNAETTSTQARWHVIGHSRDNSSSKWSFLNTLYTQSYYSVFPCIYHVFNRSTARFNIDNSSSKWSFLNTLYTQSIYSVFPCIYHVCCHNLTFFVTQWIQLR